MFYKNVVYNLNYYIIQLVQKYYSYNNLYLVKFTSKFEMGNDKETAKQDLEDFIEMLIKDPKFRYVQFCALENNPACRLYDSWLEKYGGYMNTYYKAVKLKDSKFHNTVDYVLYGERWDK